MLPVKATLLPTVSKFFDDDWNQIFDWSNSRNFNQISSLPKVNILELPDHFKIEMAAPGRLKKDFEVEIKNHLLIIRSSAHTAKDEMERSYVKKEFAISAFTRTFDLNDQLVDESQIEAKYSNGILSVVLPKNENAKEKPAQKINIS